MPAAPPSATTGPGSTSSASTSSTNPTTRSSSTRPTPSTYPLDGFDAIHASPPCQAYTAYRRRGDGVGDGHPDLIDLVRRRLQATGKPYVIENVPGAPLRNHIQLCGTSFGLDVRRHRWFESNIAILAPPCDHDQPRRFAQATNRKNLRRTVEIGVWRIPLATQRQAMGIDWMTLPAHRSHPPQIHRTHRCPIARPPRGGGMTPDPTEAIFDDLWAARLARVDTQLERIANTTYWLGRKLARHEITRDDVNRRIDALCVQLPVDDPAWVPWHMARDAALAGLRRGMGVDQ